MANVAQGTTATWGSVTLGELVTLSVDGIAADTVEITPRTATARVKVYSVADVDLGTVTITARGPAGMSSTNAGLTAALSIGGPGVAWSFSKAIFERIGWSASVGELQTYNVTFKVGG